MKKIILFLSATVFLISCSKTEYTISGTAKGIANGKTIIMETADAAGMGLIPVDTVKVENEKFEITGKATEPSFHMLTVEGIEGKFPFILENGDISIENNKDSINKSKVSGTYSNDEFVKYNEDLMKIQKDVMDFQKKNTPAMTQAQQANDTATINKLMKEYGKLQEVSNAASKKAYTTYSETHPKSFITVLIVQGMLGDPSVDIKKTEKLFEGLDESLKNTKPGKAILAKIKETKTPSVSAGAAPAAQAPVGSSK
jgi:hypothetical protein